MTDIDSVKRKLQSIERMTTDDDVQRQAQAALGDIEALEDPYTQRVVAFHDELRRHGNEDYLTVLASQFKGTDLPTPVETPHEAENVIKEAMAERNRLFWAAFLAEETGEVASCLTSGEPPENFEDEVADVLVLCFAIADCFGFDMLQAFHRVMDRNSRKPKSQDGTGKLPKEAREHWRGDEDDS